MKYIFEGNWIYLAHESQLPNNNDYLTTYIGRQPIVISRDKEGELHALINACSHKGAMLCRRKKDNRGTFTCPFHGWTFRNNGKLLKVKDPRGAGYPEQFNTEGSHDLTKVARFESYRGFLFGSLNPDVVAAGRVPRWRREDHRHDRGPVAGGSGGAQGRLHLHLRRQLEGAGRERRRRLPRVGACTGTTRPPPRGAPPASRPPRPRRWTPGSGASCAAATTPGSTATCCSGTSGETPRTGRCGTAARNGPRSSDRPARTGC